MCVRQVPDDLKAEVSREAKDRAKAMAQEALAQRLKEIEMTASESQLYSRVMEAVAREIAQLRVVLQGAETRSKERSWLKNQTTGDFDDAKLVHRALLCTRSPCLPRQRLVLCECATG